MGDESPIGASTHYHADYVTPYWADSYERVAQIDSHIFYQ
jgi:spore germination cell wall hydrolase CwlJ-like protein